VLNEGKRIIRVIRWRLEYEAMMASPYERGDVGGFANDAVRRLTASLYDLFYKL
jgi:hypothetical protein